jgi:hypothetical protein
MEIYFEELVHDGVDCPGSGWWAVKNIFGFNKKEEIFCHTLVPEACIS